MTLNEFMTKYRVDLRQDFLHRNQILSAQIMCDQAIDEMELHRVKPKEYTPFMREQMKCVFTNMTELCFKALDDLDKVE